MPVSQENMNVFWSDLIKMVPKLNYFKFMQLDYPRWLLDDVTSIHSINLKMTIAYDIFFKPDREMWDFSEGDWGLR